MGISALHDDLPAVVATWPAPGGATTVLHGAGAAEEERRTVPRAPLGRMSGHCSVRPEPVFYADPDIVA